MKNYWELIWSSFLKAQGAFINVLGIILAVVAWIFVPSTTIPLTWVIFVSILLISLLSTFIHASFVAFSISKNQLPRILMGKRPPQGSGIRAFLLLEPSDLFSNDSMVSFYYIEDGNFERLFGLGAVTNIQTDKHIQVVLSSTIGGNNNNIVRGIINNDKNTLDKILIKPSVPNSSIGTGD